MGKLQLCVERLFDGKSITENQCVDIVKGVISSITDQIPDSSEIIKGTLTAGFIDIQVNGGGGVLFNQSPTVESLKIIAKAHQKFGTTGWLPTLITDSIETMQAAADAVAEAIQDPANGILGIHFEGPNLSIAKRGIHLEEMIRPFSESEKAIFTRKDIGKVLVTVAPEAITSEQISELVDADVIVSIGHSNASFAQTKLAVEAGATGFTHLYNAMSQFNSREPGVVGAALQAEGCFSGIIVDGFHLHQAAAELAYHSKTQLMLVTDAMSTVGTDDNEFEYFGEIIHKQNGCLRDKDNNLAGSTLDMQSAVINAQDMLDISAEDCYKLASINPAKFLNLNHQLGNLEVGKKANMILLDEDSKVIQSWIEGEPTGNSAGF